jgi:protein gp37
MQFTGIAWADHTLNWWEGCTAIGPGCGERHLLNVAGDSAMAKLFKKFPGLCYAKDTNNGLGRDNFGKGKPRHLNSVEANMATLLKWNYRCEQTCEVVKFFDGSMCDILDDEVDPAWRVDWFDAMAITFWLRHIICSKRYVNWQKYAPPSWPDGYEHLTLLATVTNQQELERVVKLLGSIPATSKGLSIEPLLEEIDVRPAIEADIDWYIWGGESGPGSAPFHIEWAMKGLEPIEKAGKAFFMKQAGSNPWLDGKPLRLKDNDGAAPREWPANLRRRQYPPGLTLPRDEMLRLPKKQLAVPRRRLRC